ncbi:SLAM family member 5-like [Megalobrama amblycephala]|uniref:SLAM family member 5-like n=1 Tax=Megalobrama amblycephala TaxID=75352 RepID=UPI002014038E|nr:SLAM family member 5-like [Megalobrama amblycephala]
MAKRLGQSISETSRLVCCSWSAVVNIYQQCLRRDKPQTGDRVLDTQGLSMHEDKKGYPIWSEPTEAPPHNLQDLKDLLMSRCQKPQHTFRSPVEFMPRQGDSVTLYTDLTEIMDGDLILWRFGMKNTLIAEIDVQADTITVYDDVPDGKFRNRLKLNNQTGSLTITNITTEHSGCYELQMIRNMSKSFNLTVYSRLPVPVISSNSSQCSSSSSSSSSNCSLLCSAVNVGHVTLSWYKGNSLLSSISVSDLSISLSLPLEVEYQDKNTYSCVLNNPISNQTQHLDITHLCHTCAVTDSVSLIVLISAGSLLIVVAVGICCICRKCRKTAQVFLNQGSVDL